MRKFFYSISVFLFLCVLSFGYYGTYQMGDRYRSRAVPEPGAALQTKMSEEPSKSVSSQEGGYGLYCLREEKGFVMVYETEGNTLYEPTAIALSSLPKNLQAEIREGKYLKSQGELYGFLENYSS